MHRPFLTVFNSQERQPWSELLYCATFPDCLRFKPYLLCVITKTADSMSICSKPRAQGTREQSRSGKIASLFLLLYHSRVSHSLYGCLLTSFIKIDIAKAVVRYVPAPVLLSNFSILSFEVLHLPRKLPFGPPSGAPKL